VDYYADDSRFIPETIRETVSYLTNIEQERLCSEETSANYSR